MVDSDRLKDYHELVLHLNALYDEVAGVEFYEELFPDNENTGDYYTDYSHPNAIYLYRDTVIGEDGLKHEKQRRRIMLNDTWEEDYLEYVVGNPLALCSGLSYRKRANTLVNAQRMNALILDLDAVNDGHLRNLLETRFGAPAERGRSLPQPTFLVASGTGLHVYYLLDEPLDLYPSIKEQAKALKHDFTFKLWDWKSTTALEKPQYQSINQAFRMVGSVNGKYGNVIRAFRTGDAVSLETLNSYVQDPGHRINVREHRLQSRTPIETARKKWPTWYRERVVEGKQPEHQKWDIAGKVHGRDPYALYHWWIRQAHAIQGGHRYFYMLCMVAYARKCDVPYSTLKDDMRKVFDYLKEIEHLNPLTEHDMQSALKSWRKDFYNLRLDDIEKLTGLHFKRNKRNGRTQEKHLQGARAIRDINNENWREGNGRKPKRELVKAWRAEHPAGRKIDCERETGLSRHTVIKWWDD